MSRSYEGLLWESHRKLFHELHACDKALLQGIPEVAEKDQQWLLKGLKKFEARSDESKTAVETLKKIEFGRRGKLPVEKALVQATLDLAELLNLDEVQCHIIVRRWVKGEHPDLYKQMIAGSETPVILSAEMTEQVISYYYRERLYLLKALHYLLLAGSQDAGPAASPHLCALAKTLLSKELAETLVAQLQDNLAPGSAGAQQLVLPRASSLYLAPVLASTTSQAGVVVPDTLQSMRDHQLLKERCELLALLVLVYSHHDVRCKAETFQDLVKFIGLAMFQGSVPGPPGDTPKEVQRSEFLASLLLLAAMRLGDMLQKVQVGHATGRAVTDDMPLAAKVRSIDTEIRSWAPQPAAAMVLMTWSAYILLLAQFQIDDPGSQDHLDKASQAGGFHAIMEMLQPDVLPRGDDIASLAFRQPLLYSLSLINTAFSIQPANLAFGQLEDIITIIQRIMADSPVLCGQFWDQGSQLLAPLRALLEDSCQLFPALFTPYLRLLMGLMEGPEAAALAYDHLHNLDHVTCLHDISEYRLMGQGMQELDTQLVYLDTDVRWPLAPEIIGSTLPRGAEGKIVTMPDMYSDYEGRRVMIQWEISAQDGLGQVFLLARAFHCLDRLEATKAGREAKWEEVEDLSTILRLLSKLVHHNPALIQRLAEVSLAHTSPSNTIDFAQLVLSSIRSLVGVPGVPVDTIADAMHVCRAFSKQAPAGMALELARTSLLGVDRLVDKMPMVPISEVWTCTEMLHHLMMSDGLSGLLRLRGELEGVAGVYPVTRSFLTLLLDLLDQNCVEGPVPAWVMFVLQEILGVQHQWRYANASEQLQIICMCLRVMSSAITAGATAFPSFVMAPPFGEPLAHSVTMSPRSNTKLTALAVVIIRELCQSGQGYLCHFLPPPSEVLQSLKQSQSGSEEVEAMRALVEELMRLVGLLLDISVYIPHVVPFVQFLLLHEVRSTSCTPAQLLTSYLEYPYGAVMPQLAYQVLHGLARLLACPTYASSSMSLNLAWSKSKPSVKHLLEPFRRAVAKQYPSWLLLAVDLLEVAVVQHHDLLHALLFPSGLPAPPGTEEASLASLPGPGEQKSASPGNAKKKGVTEFSMLDALWALLQDVDNLRQHHPEVLTLTLRALCALNEYPEVSHEAMEKLQGQPGYWEAVEKCLPLPSTSDPSSGDRVSQSWIVLGEAYALALITKAMSNNPRAEPQFDRSKEPAAASTSSASPPAPLRTCGVWKVVDTMIIPRLASIIEGCRQLEIQQQLISQLMRLTQVSYLYLGGVAVEGLWGIGEQDKVACAQVLRDELFPIQDQIQKGELALDDLEEVAAELWAPSEDPMVNRSRRALKLLEKLRCNPLGEGLFVRCTSTAHLRGYSLRRGYGRDLVFDSRALMALLCHDGRTLEEGEFLSLLSATFEEVGVMSSMIHSQLSRLAALMPLVGALAADPSSRKSLQQPTTIEPIMANTNHLLQGLLHQVRSLCGYEEMSLALQPWGLQYIVEGVLGGVAGAARILGTSVLWWGNSAGRAKSLWWVEVVDVLGEWLRTMTQLHGEGTPPDLFLTVMENLTSTTLRLLQGISPSRDPEVTELMQTSLQALMPPLCSWISSIGNQILPLSGFVAFTVSLQLLVEIVNRYLVPQEWVPSLSVNLDLVKLYEVTVSRTAQLSSRTEDVDMNNRAGLMQPSVPGQASVESVRSTSGPYKRSHHRGTASSHWYSGVEGSLPPSLPPSLPGSLPPSLPGSLPSSKWPAMDNPNAVADIVVSQLMLAVASRSEGAVMLHEQGVLDALPAACCQLLNSLAGALGLPDPKTGAASGTQFSGTERSLDEMLYLPNQGGWSPIHQQWCELLRLSTVVYRNLGQVLPMDQHAVSFLLVAMYRIQHCCSVPWQEGSQSLSLAAVMETQSALKFLVQMTSYLGAWQAALATSLNSFRQTVSQLVGFIGQFPQSRSPLSCPPQGAFEMRLRNKKTNLVYGSGWLRVAENGSSPDNTSGNGSEYAARLAEGVYACAELGLLFLHATSPQASPGEAALLGPSWPKKQALASLWDHVIATAASQLPDNLRPLDPRRHRLCSLLLHIHELCEPFLEALGYVPNRRHRDRGRIVQEVRQCLECGIVA